MSQRADSIIEDEDEESDVALKDHDSGGAALHYEDWFGPPGETWPDGPRRRISEAFRRACLGSPGALDPVIVANPHLAREVILALLIREPLPEDKVGLRESYALRDCDIASVPEWWPAAPFHGPFMSFLKLAPSEAIDTIVRLVNFATERYLSHTSDHAEEAAPVTVDTTRGRAEWRGGLHVYYWYREHMTDAHAVPVALMAIEKWLYDLAEANEEVDIWITRIISSSTSVAFAGVLSAVGRRYPQLFSGSLRPIIATWQFQYWEQEYTDNQWESALGLTMVSWVKWGERIWDIMKEWHTLPHRKSSLHATSMRLFLSDHAMRSILEEVRARWQRELAALEGDGRSHAFLEQLIARHDIGNWRIAQTADGIQVEYRAPSELVARWQDKADQAVRAQKILAFPAHCRERLEQRKPLGQEELEPFWNVVNELASYRPEELDADLARARCDAVIAGISVLIVFHGDWLSEDADRVTWCRDRIIEVLEDPPERHEFDIAESVFERRWDTFLAESIPVLLAEGPEIEFLRRTTAELALAFHYVTIGKLMRRTFELRDVLADDFFRLQRMVVMWAGIREVYRVTQSGNSIFHTPHVPLNASPFLIAIRDGFVFKTTPVKPVAWSRVSRLANRRILRMVRREFEEAHGRSRPADVEEKVARKIQRLPGLNVELLERAYEWLPGLDDAQSEEERLSWITIVEEELGSVLRSLGGANDARADEDDHFGLTVPTQWHRRVFRRIATIVPQMRSYENPERLWMPLLRLGVERHYWVEGFFSSWFLDGLKVDGHCEEFFREWRRMIEAVFSSGLWPPDSRRGWAYREEMFLKLMGLDWACELLKEERFRPFLGSFAREYKRWADQWLKQADSAKAFARFLIWPSAQELTRDGLLWLNESASAFSEYEWDDEGLAPALLDLLEHLWKTHKAAVRSDTEVRAAFMGLLKRMADQLFPRALELQDRIGR